MVKKFTLSLQIPSYLEHVSCGEMTQVQAEDFLKEIAQHTEIPQDSCLYSLSIDLYNHTDKKYILKNNEHNTQGIQEKQKCHIPIEIIRKNQNKCPHERCCHKISEGKCRDEFVINLIGRTLFPDKYNDRQK